MAQTIIVTGASAGIGLAIATYLANHPSKPTLICCCNSNDKPLRALQSESGSNDRILIVKGDMADSKFVDTVLAQSLLHFGIESVDALILNHGTLGQSKRIEGTSWSEWEDVMRVNVGSYVAMVSRRCVGRGKTCEMCDADRVCRFSI
jgi:NAD(P)-dependent dehydrogenase (short-subunit alcohol dehydrogenase family)